MKRCYYTMKTFFARVNNMFTSIAEVLKYVEKNNLTSFQKRMRLDVKKKRSNVSWIVHHYHN